MKEERFYQAADYPERLQKDVRFKKSNEFREPKKGEWYLSGAVVEAYRAPNDLSGKYWIAKRVSVRLVPARYEEV
jgi:hypothetical protein